MRLLAIAFFALLGFTNFVDLHEAVSAKFHIVERGEVLFLEIEFDQENLVKLNKTNSLIMKK